MRKLLLAFLMVKKVKAVVAASLVVGLLAAVACQGAVQTVEVTREVEVTRKVEVPQQIEVTREIEVTRIVEVPQHIEVTREVEVTRVVEVSPQIEATQVVIATHGPTSSVTPTPTINSRQGDRAELWIALYDAGYSSPRIGAGANPAFDVDVYDLKVTVRAGRLSETFFNTQKIYAGNGVYNSHEYFELIPSLERELSSVVEVSAQTPQGNLSCERDKRSTTKVLTYACGWRK